MHTSPYKKYPYDSGETSKSQRSKDITDAILFAIPASASVKMLESVKDQEQRYSINLGFREIDSCEIIITELDEWDNPATRFGSIDINFDPGYSKTAEVILKDFTDRNGYIKSYQSIELTPLDINDGSLFEDSLKPKSQDPAVKLYSEMFSHEFSIPAMDFRFAIQDILRSLIESCLAKGLKFSSTILADKMDSISYAHEEVLELLNKPMLVSPGEHHRDTLETWNNKYSPKPIEVIPAKTRDLLHEIFSNKK